MELTSKERMQLTIDHKEPDRVPYQAMFVPEIEGLLIKKYKKELGESGGKVLQKFCGVSPLDILFGHDMLLLAYGISTGYFDGEPVAFIAARVGGNNRKIWTYSTNDRTFTELNFPENFQVASLMALSDVNADGNVDIVYSSDINTDTGNTEENACSGTLHEPMFGQWDYYVTCYNTLYVGRYTWCGSGLCEPNENARNCRE